jgi:hypothetical protein
MLKSALILVVLAGGLTLTACGDPSESVPQSPIQDVGETEYEFNIIVPGGSTTTKIPKPPVQTIPKYTPPVNKPVPPAKPVPAKPNAAPVAPKK